MCRPATLEPCDACACEVAPASTTTLDKGSWSKLAPPRMHMRRRARASPADTTIARARRLTPRPRPRRRHRRAAGRTPASPAAVAQAWVWAARVVGAAGVGAAAELVELVLAVLVGSPPVWPDSRARSGPRYRAAQRNEQNPRNTTNATQRNSCSEQRVNTLTYQRWYECMNGTRPRLHPPPINPQPLTLNPHPSTLNPQTSTLYPHPSSPGQADSGEPVSAAAAQDDHGRQARPRSRRSHVRSFTL